MSDTSQGLGWWLASDGKWYPPELWTGSPLPTDLSPAAGPMPGYPPFHGSLMVAAPPTNGLALASLVCACAGILPFFGIIASILAVIFGFIGRSQIKRSNGNQRGSGMALAGIIVGFSVLALTILGIVLIAVFSHTQHRTTVGNTTTCTVS